MTDRYTMERGDLLSLLKRHGWLQDEDDPTSRELMDTVAVYQHFSGEFVDGVAGRATERSLEAIRFCSRPDKMETGMGLQHWGKRDLTYRVAGSLAGFQPLDLNDCFARSVKQWADVANINIKGSDGASADITCKTGPIDRRGGTLAWSEMPNVASLFPLNQLYDSLETWVAAINPGNSIDLIAVIVHEMGHALGIPHLPGNGIAIMNPIYRPGLRTLQEADVREIQARYGRRTTEPEPDEPDEPSTPGDWCSRFLTTFFNELSEQEQNALVKVGQRLIR